MGQKQSGQEQKEPLLPPDDAKGQARDVEAAKPTNGYHATNGGKGQTRERAATDPSPQNGGRATTSGGGILSIFSRASQQGDISKAPHVVPVPRPSVPTRAESAPSASNGKATEAEAADEQASQQGSRGGILAWFSRWRSPAPEPEPAAQQSLPKATMMTRALSYLSTDDSGAEEPTVWDRRRCVVFSCKWLCWLIVLFAALDYWQYKCWQAAAGPCLSPGGRNEREISHGSDLVPEENLLVASANVSGVYAVYDLSHFRQRYDMMYRQPASLTEDDRKLLLNSEPVGHWTRFWGPLYWTYIFTDATGRPTLSMRASTWRGTLLYTDEHIRRCDGRGHIWRVTATGSILQNHIRQWMNLDDTTEYWVWNGTIRTGYKASHCVLDAKPRPEAQKWHLKPNLEIDYEAMANKTRLGRAVRFENPASPDWYSGVSENLPNYVVLSATVRFAYTLPPNRN